MSTPGARRRLPGTAAPLFAVGMALSPPAHAECTDTAWLSDVQRTLAVGASAYAEMDTAGAESAWLQVETALPCVAEKIDPSLALDIHQGKGLADFASDRPAGAKASFAAMRSIDPDWRFPEEVVPDDPDYPEWTALTAIELESGRTETVPEPAPGIVVRFDGEESLERQLAWPTVIQILDEAKVVQVTEYLEPNHPLPDYPHMGPSQRSESLRRASRITTWSGAGVLAAGVGVTTFTLTVMALNCNWEGSLRPETCWGQPGDGLNQDQRKWLVGYQSTSGALLGVGAAGLVGGAVLRGQAKRAGTRLEVTGSF